MKLIVSSEFWLKHARDNHINWSYHTVDEHAVGRVEFTPKARPDVRAMLVKKGTLCLMGMTSRGRSVVQSLANDDRVEP